MIKVKVASWTISKSSGSMSKFDLETYIDENQGIPDAFYENAFYGDAIIMTEEEYEAKKSEEGSLRKELKEKEGEIYKLREENTVCQYDLKIVKLGNSRLRNLNREIVKMQEEKIKKLKEENKSLKVDIMDLKEKMAQDAGEIDLQPDGTIVFKLKRVSELEKEIKELREENKALKNKDDEFSIKVTGGLFYHKED